MPTRTHLDDDLAALDDRLVGELVVPDHAGYDAARAVWNGMIDRRPRAIARCADTADVAAALTVARAHDLPLAVRGGGHNVAGTAVCDDGLVIDLSTMTGVRVDPEARTARVQAGATWADVDAATQEHGLATVGGVDSRTGVGGLTLGGGNGWLARTHGLTVDNLLAVDLVTADGAVVHASADEHPELFWALRGGGGNFGVVTSFEYRLHPIGPEVLVTQAFHRFDDLTEVLRFHRDYVAAAPDEVSCYAMILHVPPIDAFPAEHHGAPAVALVAVHSGDVDEAGPLLAPVEGHGDPIVAFTTPTPYTALQQSFDAGTPDGARYHYRSQFLADLSDDAIATLATLAGRLPGEFTMVGIEPMGGAVNRVPADATAFPHRDAAFNLGIWAGWSDPGMDAEATAWARELHAAMTPHATGGVYVNYLDRDEAARVEDAYAGHLARLRDVKQTWDPDNVFRGNHNIRPRG
jgi:FAD/FMN-containing dehydrogenase